MEGRGNFEKVAEKIVRLKSLDPELFEAINIIIDTLLDKSPLEGISAYEHAEGGVSGGENCQGGGTGDNFQLN